MPSPSSVVCDRVRAQVSLLLDDELSQLERRMVAHHLERCAACSAVAGEMTAYTELLRAAPLEPLSRPVSVSRRARTIAGRAQIGIAAAVVVAFAGVVGPLAGSKAEHRGLTRQGTPISYPSQAQLDREMAIIQAGPSLRSSNNKIF